MDAQSYVEWCRYAGLYLGNESHFARYRAYGEKISPCGLATAIVGEFLEDNSPVLNLQEWRNYRVYEINDQAQVRLEQTAAALEAISARRAAAKIRTLKSTSPMDMLMGLDLSSPDALMSAMKDVKLGDLMKAFREHVSHAFPEVAPGRGQASEPAPPDPDIESREQIEHLLQQYVTLHEGELQADIDKHGDPRKAPGFTPEGRMHELERQHRLQCVQDKQKEDLQELQALMDKIAKRLGKGTPPQRLSSVRREFLECYRRNRGLAKEELTPAMRQMLERAGRFIEEHKSLFRPDPVSDPELLQRLAAFGEYDVDLAKDTVGLRWDSPKGFDCSWTTFSLAMDFPKDDQESLRTLLGAAERLANRFANVADAWRRQLIESFRGYSGMMAEADLEDYELDDAGEATEESILRHAGHGGIHLVADPENDYVSTQTHFAVDWDEEHGFELAWEDEAPKPAEPATQESADFSCGHVQISHSGPALTRERIAAFEKRFSVRLPSDYCRFLLTHNGGVPAPNHLALRNQGVLFPVDVERFYSILGDDAADGSLELATKELRSQSLPPELLPIAELSAQDVEPVSADAVLLLVVSAKNAGHLVVFQPAALAMPFASSPAQALGLPHDILLSMSIKAAKGLGDLFEKLTTRPEVKSPEWLKLIQEGRTEELLRWLRDGGKLTDSFKGYGQPYKMSVIDYLAKDAPPAMLEALVDSSAITPKQLHDSWQRFQGGNVGRFAELMAVLPKQMWGQVLASPFVWNHPNLLERLAAAAVDFNAPVNDEGMPPLHLAVQYGHKDAVRWLIAHGADIHKEDKYQRTAFIWAESGPGFDCLPLLQGQEENPVPPREPMPDAPGIAALWQAARDLPKDQDILVSIQIKSPPVTRIEKAYYHECHYRLSIYVQGDKVVFNDMNTARQEYLYAGKWPTFLFTPILQWPELTPLWATLEVREFDWARAVKKRNYQGPLRADLLPHARSALEQAFNAEEAAARGIRLRK